MPIKILEKDTEKRKAKRGQTKGDDDEAIFRKEKAPGTLSRRRYFKKETHGGGPDAGHIGKLKDALQKFKDRPILPKKPDLSKIKEKMPKYMKPLKKGGRAKHNIGGRANLLEEMGRIDARRHPDAADRAEKRRVIGELNKGYKSGGVVLKGKKVGCQIK